MWSTGHTASDPAETVLLNLARGRDPAWAQKLAPPSPFRGSRGLVRPAAEPEPRGDGAGLVPAWECRSDRFEQRQPPASAATIRHDVIARAGGPSIAAASRGQCPWRTP